MFGAPPRIKSARLFRILLQRARPAWPIDFRFRSLPGARLRVQALRGLELESCFDAADGESDAMARRAITLAHIMAASLIDSSGSRIVMHSDDFGDLEEDEFNALTLAVMNGLAIVSPSCTRGQPVQWEAALAKGAEHGSNLDEALRIGRCERPSDYFGMPLADLTDGHLMVHRVCAELVGKARRSLANRPRGFA